ncbi:MAG: AMP-binding protein [Kofleriaceae bacterium]|nr:AMP-binding protein [Kofleriaceae bacterium]
MISRAAAVAAAAASAANLGWRDDDRWLCCLPLAHAGGLTVVLRCLIARRPLILHEGPFDAAAVAALASSARATLASLVPTQLDALVAVADAGAAPPPWRAILLGSAAAAPALLARAAARGLPFVVTYGMTESLGQVATAPLSAAGRVDAAPRALPGFTMTAGTATAPAPITVAGPSLLTGWLGEPARDAGAPLTTSDLGWLDDDGGLHVVGRADDVIVTGGENVHPAQVEAAVAGAPGVAAACAFGIADPRWGQVVACAVVGAADLDLAHLDGWLAARLPAHLRPRRLIRVDVLPVGPTGKIDRRAAARACAGAASPA